MRCDQILQRMRITVQMRILIILADKEIHEYLSRGPTECNKELHVQVVSRLRVRPVGTVLAESRTSTRGGEMRGLSV